MSRTPMPPHEKGRPGRRPCPGPGQRPLPDPADLRLCAVPDTAPPYDDEALAGPGAPGWAGAPRGGTGRAGGPGSARPPGQDLAGEHTGAAGAARPPAELGGAAPPAVRGGAARPAVRGGGEHPAVPGGGEHPAVPGGGEHPAVRGRPAVPGGGEHPAVPGQFAQVLIETLAGSRPPRQMASWTTQRARSRIQRLGPALSAGPRPQLRRVVAFQPRPDVIEMTLVLSCGPRIRALAVRLEQLAPRHATIGQRARPARWCCTEVEAA
jgi:hypothetical protein